MAGITEKDIVVEPSDTVDPPSYEEVTAASAPNGASAGVKSSEHAQAASWMTPSTATVTQYPQQHYHSRNSIEGQGQLYYGQYTPYNQQGVASNPGIQHITIVERTYDHSVGVTGSFKKDALVLTYSIISALFCCLLLGIVAIIYSISAFCIRDVDARKADKHTNIALKVSHAGVVCGLIVYSIVVVAILVMVT